MMVSSTTMPSDNDITPTDRRQRAHFPGTPVVLTMALLSLLVVPPLVAVIIRSFQGTTILGQAAGWTFSNYSTIASTDLGRSISNSLILAVAAGGCAILVGGGLAWIAERTDAIGARFCRIMMIATFAFPFLVYAYSWTLLWGNYGPIYETLKALFGLQSPLFSATSLPSLAIALGLLFCPFSFLIISATLRRRNVALEEAAQIAGASNWKIFRKITLPMIRPALIGIGLLIGILTLQAFDLPAILGIPGNVHVLTTGIFVALQVDQPANYGAAAAYAVVLLLLVTILVVFASRYTQNTSAYAVINSRGSSYSQKKIALGRFRILGLIPYGLFALLSFVGPIGISVWTSFLPYYQNPSFKLLSHLTWSNYTVIFQNQGLSTTLWNTFVIGVVVASGGTMLSAVAAWLTLRHTSIVSKLIRHIAIVPLVFPGIVLALAIATIYVRIPGPLYGSVWLLMIAYVTQLLPIGFTYNHAGIAQVHKELEESAVVAGVSRRRVLSAIVLPLAAPSFVASWVLLFLLSGKEFSIPILLSGPNSQVVSVQMFNMGNDGHYPEIFAIAVMWTILSLVMMAAVLGTFWLARNWRRVRSTKGSRRNVSDTPALVLVPGSPASRGSVP